MGDLSAPVQVATALIVGIGSGLGSALLAQRHNDARYVAQRRDALIPAARSAATYYYSQGEYLMGLRSNPPDGDSMLKATAGLNEYRHDLPVDIQRRFADLRPDAELDMFETGDVMCGIAVALLDWVDAESGVVGVQAD